MNLNKHNKQWVRYCESVTSSVTDTQTWCLSSVQESPSISDPQSKNTLHDPK